MNYELQASWKLTVDSGKFPNWKLKIPKLYSSLSFCLLTWIRRGGRPCPPALASSVKWSCIIKSRGFQVSGSLWWGSSRRVRERKVCDLYEFSINSTDFRLFSLLPASPPSSSEEGTNLEAPTFYNTTPLRWWCQRGRTGTSAATKSRQQTER